MEVSDVPGKIKELILEAKISAAVAVGLLESVKYEILTGMAMEKITEEVVKRSVPQLGPDKGVG